VGEELEDLLREVEKRGFKVYRRVKLEGTSGFGYYFDVVVENPATKKKAALTYISEVGARHVLPLLTCKVDVDVVHLVLAKTADPIATILLKEAGMDVVLIDPSMDKEKVVEKLRKILGEL